MDDWTQILAWMLLASCGLAVWFWVWGLFVARRTLAGRRSIRDADPKTDGRPVVSIIVPVHNGETTIDACATRLRSQQCAAGRAGCELEIIFVLDRCSDDTHRVLSRHVEADDRVVVVHAEPCPRAWSGKCHAAWTGAQRARGQWLLFTDADTRFHPELVDTAVGAAQRDELALLSLLSTLRCRHWFERVAQPVATMHLMRMYPPDRAADHPRPRPFANGQFLLFRRDWYERIGGHAAVRGRLLEDLALARLVHAAGGRATTLGGSGMLVCSMYDSLAAFRGGWKRIYIEACRLRPLRLRRYAWRLLVFGTLLPLLQVGSLALAFLGPVGPALAQTIVVLVASGWTVQGLVLLLAHRHCGAPLWSIPAHPLGCWIIGCILLDGAHDLEQRRPVTWAGRRYMLEPRYGDEAPLKPLEVA